MEVICGIGRHLAIERVSAIIGKQKTRNSSRMIEGKRQVYPNATADLRSGYRPVRSRGQRNYFFLLLN